MKSQKRKPTRIKCPDCGEYYLTTEVHYGWGKCDKNPFKFESAKPMSFKELILRNRRNEQRSNDSGNPGVGKN